MALSAALLLGGCGALSGLAGRGASPYPQDTAETPAGPPRPLAAAATDLADALLTRAGAAAQPPGGAGRRFALVVDPFVDRSTGLETAATRAAVARIQEHVRARYPSVELRPLNVAGVADGPLVLLGGIAGVAENRGAAPADGPPRAYRMRAVLADPRTGRVLDAATALVRAEDVNTAPAPFFRDAPGWLPDPAVAAYLRTVDARPGAAIDPTYAQGLTVGALVGDGMVAYEAGRYREALDRYAEAQRLPAGDQMRVHNGLYLSTWALGRRREAEEAFARVVDFGLRQERLAVKFLFRPGSTAFVPDPSVSAPYGMWIRQIALQTDERSACILLTGHASPTGTAAANDRLSRGRAEYLRTRLVQERARLRERTRAAGVGAREPLVGTGADNASDSLDRRVEFGPLLCANLDAAAEAVNSRAGSGTPGRAPL
jgi:outer membrane protein OmpA-like peptidoglycan-associated protein